MFVLAAISPGLAVRTASTVPHAPEPRADLLSTLAVLLIGILLIAGAIRTVLRQ
ncbi:MAG: hypothetical protein ABSG84_00685 [Acidobacteriaceae bacterium]|jgi:hypothetical protein